MYHSHWGLSASPFQTGADADFFFSSNTHREALARLHYLVENHRRLGLLLGDAGSGKSLTLKYLRQELLRQKLTVAQLRLTGLGLREFLWSLNAELGVNPSTQEGAFPLWRRLQDRILEARIVETPIVILLDDVDAAGTDGLLNESGREVLAHIVRLAQADTAPQPLVTFVLSCGVGHLSQLGQRLLDLAELRIDLRPWSVEDVRGYVTTSLSRAGREEPAFDDDAIVALQELAQGSPRRVSQLADLSLLAGAGKQLGQVDRPTVESVYGELNVSPSSTAADLVMRTA